MSGDARGRILGRIREALADREPVGHPGDFAGWRPEPVPDDLLGAFEALFHTAGGETHRLPTSEVAAWISRFASSWRSAVVGSTVPPEWRPPLADVDAREADMAVSIARGAVAETGSLVLDARDGRRAQLLAPVHVVVVPAGTVHATLADALTALRADLPSAIGLHSGPSKSADIGQVMVRGVHGPGRIVALLLTGHDDDSGSRTHREP